MLKIKSYLVIIMACLSTVVYGQLQQDLATMKALHSHLRSSHFFEGPHSYQRIDDNVDELVRIFREAQNSEVADFEAVLEYLDINSPVSNEFKLEKNSCQALVLLDYVLLRSMVAQSPGYLPEDENSCNVVYDLQEKLLTLEEIKRSDIARYNLLTSRYIEDFKIFDIGKEVNNVLNRSRYYDFLKCLSAKDSIVQMTNTIFENQSPIKDRGIRFLELNFEDQHHQGHISSKQFMIQFNDGDLIEFAPGHFEVCEKQNRDALQQSISILAEVISALNEMTWNGRGFHLILKGEANRRSFEGRFSTYNCLNLDLDVFQDFSIYEPLNAFEQTNDDFLDQYVEKIHMLRELPGGTVVEDLYFYNSDLPDMRARYLQQFFTDTFERDDQGLKANISILRGEVMREKNAENRSVALIFVIDEETFRNDLKELPISQLHNSRLAKMIKSK
ncbi:MAG: hypothetical protein R8G66_26645 [Cytophagales bacterium]|nr:hypothetical protein [Cytophagales bacterium]